MSAPRTKNPVPDWIEQPYPHLEHSLVSFPAKHILLVTINRPEFMNCLPVEATIELGALWKWYDAEPELYVSLFSISASQDLIVTIINLLRRCAVFTGVSPMLHRYRKVLNPGDRLKLQRQAKKRFVQEWISNNV
jgi:hypothetical protein